MKELLVKFVDFIGLAYWAEIVTDYPRCVYYFGPFLSKQEAQVAKGGYIEDLENEQARGISVDIKRCKPNKLTIFDEKEEGKKFPSLSTLRSQMS